MKKSNSREVWHCISRTFLQVRAAIRQEFRTSDLTPAQLDVVLALEVLGPATQTELAEHLLVTKGNVSIVLKGLLEKRLIRRKTPGDNRRLNIVSLTDSGKKLSKRLSGQHVRKLSSLFSGLTHQEQKKMVSLFEQLHLSMESEKKRVNP